LISAIYTFAADSLVENGNCCKFGYNKKRMWFLSSSTWWFGRS